MNEPRATVYESPGVDKQFFSLGYMAQFFQRPIETLRAILSAAEIKPAYLQNDVPFFDGAALLTVRHALDKAQADG
ncbi:MAG: hypothetical protein NTY19_18440 [Planctomycetota bacterium]|nr:hypothetical protein [Planctomycetota bacterium]